MQLDDYMRQKYPNLILKPPLFYNWKDGIRYELGDPDESDPHKYIKGAIYRAMTLFKEIHHQNDELFLVLNDHLPIDRHPFKHKPVKVFNHSVKSKELLYKLKHKVIPFVFEDDDEMETHRYTLPCLVRDISYRYLITFICKHKPKTYFDLFFVNVTKDIIFHVYDDCGCDVIASDKENIRFLYEKYNEWILDYDRKAIDYTFKDSG